MSLPSGGRASAVCALLAALSLTAMAAAAPSKGSYASAVVVAADSGETLVAHDADAPREPASLVKLMMSLIARDRAGTTTFNRLTPIRASAYASKMGGSQVYLKHNEVFTLAEMLRAMEIASANDTAVAIAEAIAGSTDAMVQLMNARARDLNMTGTTFANVHGLPTSPGKPRNVTTARDMATLARELIARHPDMLETTAIRTAPFRAGKFTLDNTNKHFLKAFKGADGLKTGYHDQAKFNIVGTARREDMRLITVVLGAASTKDRTREASRLLKYAFVTYKRDTVLEAGERLPDQVYVEGSAHKYAPLQVAGSLAIFAKRSEFQNVRIVPIDVPELRAPIAAGTPAGMIVAKLGSRELGTAPLVVAEAVDRAPFFWRLWHWRTPRPTRGRFMQPGAQLAGGL